MTAKVLRDVEAGYQKHFDIVDTTGIVIVASVAAAHYVDGEMIWLKVIGPSRSGKTELLRPYTNHADVIEMEAVTPAALRGGMSHGHRLLPYLDGKFVVTKDLSPLLTLRSEVRNEVLGLLRNIKDGHLVSDFNTPDGGRLEQTARFDWIVAATPVVQQFRQIEGLLGARFIDLIPPVGNRLDMAVRAATNNSKLEHIREELSATAQSLLDYAKTEASKGVRELAVVEAKQLADWADLTALLRTPVPRDHNHQVAMPPSPEVGTDVAQAFTRIAKGLKVLGVQKHEPYLAKLAWDSIPQLRVEVVLSLLEGRTLSVISGRDSATAYEVENLRLLGVLETGNAHYRLSPELEKRLRTMASFHANTHRQASLKT